MNLLDLIKQHQQPQAAPVVVNDHEGMGLAFGLPQPELPPVAIVVSPSKCGKCGGSGRFMTRSGRDFGPCFTCDGTGKPKNEARHVGVELAGNAASFLSECFDSAVKAGLRKPKMRFDAFHAELAPATGKNPGAVYCISSGARTYLGKIIAGRFFGSRDCTGEQQQAVADAMADPLAAAVSFARRSGVCSCCGAELTDPASIAAGIGPICARNYGLRKAA